MEIAEIARRMGLPDRKVRYAVDHSVLPGHRGKAQSSRVGRARAFTPLEACCVAAAALLLDGGVRRATVQQLFDWLADLRWPPPGWTSKPSPMQLVTRPTYTLQALFAGAEKNVVIEIGDGEYLRLHIGASKSDWIEPRRGVRLQDYQARVEIRLNLDTVIQALNRPPS